MTYQFYSKRTGGFWVSASTSGNFSFSALPPVRKRGQEAAAKAACGKVCRRVVHLHGTSSSQQEAFVEPSAAFKRAGREDTGLQQARL